MNHKGGPVPVPDQQHDQDSEVHRLRDQLAQAHELIELQDALIAKLRLTVAEYRDTDQQLKVVVWRVLKEAETTSLDGLTYQEVILEHADGTPYLWTMAIKGQGLNMTGITTWTQCP